MCDALATGHNLHRVSFFTARGLSPDEVASLSMPFAVGLVVGQVGLGLKIDSMPSARRMSILRNAYGAYALVIGYACLPAHGASYLGSTTGAGLWMFLYGTSAG